MSQRASRGLLVWVSLVLGVALLQAFYLHLSFAMLGRERPFAKHLIATTTWSATGGALFFAVRWLVRHYPLRGGLRLRRAPAYAGAALLFGLAQTSVMWLLRVAVHRATGVGDPLPRTASAYVMELPIQAMVFAVMAGVLHSLEALRRARERELKDAHLESRLARSELRSLRLQLQPHFLFNALNTVSAAMYRDTLAADEMLAQLARLLRASLRTEDEVSLEVELKTLDCYLAIMRARFGDRLEVRVDVEPRTRQALVPSMILQPLVENAIRHGSAERTGEGRIGIRVSSCGPELALEVENEAPGSARPDSTPAAGMGLSVTMERLQLLYGDAGRLEVRHVDGPSPLVVVRVMLPLRIAREAER
jgi:two-component system LytT family sensor kinase